MLDQIATLGWDVFLAGLGLAGIVTGVIIGTGAIVVLLGFLLSILKGK